MNHRLLRYFVVAFISIVCGVTPLRASETCPDCGSVSGSIQVWKTKVKTKGAKSARDVLVYLEPVGGEPSPPGTTQVSMDQLGLVFLPHVLAVQKGTTVTFLNSDHVDHNVYFLFERTGETLDIGTWGYGISKTYQFNDPGPVITLCKLHLEMAAHILVLDNPFFTLTQIEEGPQKALYAIKNVPPGNYTLKTWHKKLKMKGLSVPITVQSRQETHQNIVITKTKYAK
ncbi:hypothetical protein DSLASN_43940 [Desulfoluna limicola]|uniref:Blue (type 1) copper domain-containing protein n=1 Tax=Desulfoluna limicola TaxID=2810562 RepID=A0ABN6FAM0_9BACT|nr:hypothetical protein [Desulfoluna limicola]BCS98762.1 hypothetical protein DSLASN_43940 [Desulfoluna limicola]